MKIRLGHVSNSSSSSFVCEICGRKEITFDGSADEVDMIYCENGHLMCNSEVGTVNEDMVDDDNEEYYGCLKTEYCPICQFKELSLNEASSYFAKNSKITREEVFAEVKKVNRRRKVLKNQEYVEYCLSKQQMSTDDFLKFLLDTYKTHEAFMSSLR